MQTAFGMTTAPRSVGYLKGSLESLRAAGIDDVAVFNDQDKVLGPYRNFKRAVRVLLEDCPAADAICIFQDDIHVADCLGDMLAGFAWPDDRNSIGVVSLYTALPHQWNRSGWATLPLSINDPADDSPHGAAGLAIVAAELAGRGAAFTGTGFQHLNGLKCLRVYETHSMFAAIIPDAKWKPQTRWFVLHGQDVTETRCWTSNYGACAYLMPRESARQIVECCQHPESKNKTDIHVAETCARLGLSIWMHSPSFVEHVGEHSTLHDFPITDFRRAGIVMRPMSELVSRV